MGKFEDTFKAILTDYLRDEMGWDILEVSSYEQVERSGGYRETCYYEEIVVKIDYVDSSGEPARRDLWENFAELVQNLESFDSRR